MKNKYTDEQRQTIINRYISDGETYPQINADTGIAKSTFYSWLKKYNVEKDTAKKKTVNYRNFMLLENKVERLENMVDILEIVGGIEDIPLRKKLYLAERFYNEYSVHLICETWISQEVHFTTIFYEIKKIILGMQSEKRNCDSAYKKHMMKTDKFLGPIK